MRIYPVLIGALIVTFLCDLGSRQFAPVSEKLGDTGVEAFFINLASLQGVFGHTYGSNGPLWTLSIEVQFYVLYPFLLLSMKRFGKFWIFLMIATSNIASFFLFERGGYSVFSSYYLSWYLGVLVAEYERDASLSALLIRFKFRAMFYSLSVFCFIVGCVIFFTSSFMAFQIWAISFANFLLVFLSRSTELSGWTVRFLRWIGTFSFSIYIVHLPVVVLIHSILFHSVHQDSLVPFICTFILVIIFAFCFSIFFERPALELSHRLKSVRRVGFGV